MYYLYPDIFVHLLLKIRYNKVVLFTILLTGKDKQIRENMNRKNVRI